MRARRRRRPRARRPAGPSAGDLVLVAAEVSGLAPGEVLAGTDVEVVVGIAGRARELADPVAAAGEVLVGVAAGRPFARANAATAWLAAMHVLAERGLAVVVDDDAAADLVHGARLGRLGEADVSARLAEWTRPTPGPWRAIARRVADVATATRPVPVRLAVCPVCDRVIGGTDRWPLAIGLAGNQLVRAAVCAREHGHHDARGVAHPSPTRPAPARWCPVVFGVDVEEGAPFVAITDEGPVAFLPTDDGDGDGDELDVVLVGHLTASDLIGSWDRLGDRGDVIGRVPSGACHLDEAGTAIDWHGVIAATTDPRGALVSA